MTVTSDAVDPSATTLVGVAMNVESNCDGTLAATATLRSPAVAEVNPALSATDTSADSAA